jgi:hypothetical protein
VAAGRFQDHLVAGEAGLLVVDLMLDLVDLKVLFVLLDRRGSVPALANYLDSSSVLADHELEVDDH